MKAIVNTAPNQLSWLECALPDPGPGHVRIRTAACGICATDLVMIAGWERTGYPTIPGHEWSGYVDAVGLGVDPSLVGQPCVAENVLADGFEVGFEHPGGYGQYLVTEGAKVHLLPKDYPIRQAALIEPLAVVTRGLKKLRLADQGQVRQAALIFGDGPIGLISVMLLHHFGVEDLCLVGGRPTRLALAQYFGAQETLNYHQITGSLNQAILARHAAGFGYIIEATGSGAALDAAVEVTSTNGKVLVMGDYGAARASFRWIDLLHRELALIGSNASADAWEEAVDLAVHANLPLAHLITHHFSAEQFQLGYDLARSRADDVIKVMLDWDGRSSS
jgi:2-desacetyl-2-hydroxyethyl bacteriochlorophyllide A dehydrogenase